MKNKDRLEKEWEALCAYQAEPSASTAGLKDGNAKKNRSAAVVACKQSTVCLFFCLCWVHPDQFQWYSEGTLSESGLQECKMFQCFLKTSVLVGYDAAAFSRRDLQSSPPRLTAGRDQDGLQLI